jgi:hypothetical protein
MKPMSHRPKYPHHNLKSRFKVRILWLLRIPSGNLGCVGVPTLSPVPLFFLIHMCLSSIQILSGKWPWVYFVFQCLDCLFTSQLMNNGPCTNCCMVKDECDKIECAQGRLSCRAAGVRSWMALNFRLQSFD